MSMCGGISGDPKPPDIVIHCVLDSVRSDLWPELLEKLKTHYPTAQLGLEHEPQINLLPLSYKTQLVAGTNYFVKVEVSHNSQAFEPKVFHARIYQSFDKTTKFVSLTPWKEVEDPIE